MSSPAAPITEAAPGETPFNDISCVNDWASADYVIISFDNIHSSIYKILRQDPISLPGKLLAKNGLLSVDRACSCQMESNVIFGPEARFICPGCSAVSSLGSVGAEIKTVKIQAGRYSGLEFEIETFLIGEPVCTVGPGPSNRAASLVRCRPCDEDLLTARYLECDTFTHTYLVAMVWEHYMREKRLPALHVMAGFVCSGLGYLLLQNKGKIADLSPSANNFRALVFQILLQLRVGIELQLTLGLVDLSILEFDPAPLNTEVEGRQVTLPFQLYLRLNHRASLSISGQAGQPATRLFLRRSQTEAGLSRLRNGCDLQARTRSDSCNDFCSPEAKHNYKLTPNTRLTFTYLREGGIPVYRGSIDFYALFLSLMCWKPFYDTTRTDEVLRGVWNRLWEPMDLEIMEDEVKSYHGKKMPSFSELIDMVVGVEMQCDPITPSWEAMKKIYLPPSP